MKVKLFIDGFNFYRSMTRAGGYNARVDYSVMAAWICSHLSSDAVFWGAQYYTGVSSQVTPAVNRFLSGLEKVRGFVVVRENRRARNTVCPHCDKTINLSIEKGVDTRMSVDMICFAAEHACDAIVILSGDEDFVPAAQAVAKFGVQTWAATWGNELSQSLRNACFGHIPLMQGVKTFEIKEKPWKTTPPTSESVISTETST